MSFKIRFICSWIGWPHVLAFKNKVVYHNRYPTQHKHVMFNNVSRRKRRKSAKRGLSKGCDAISALRAMLSSGELVAGQRLSERQLARELGISRTPIRQAIQHFAQLKVLNSEHGSGTIVRALPLEEYEETVEARAAIEAMTGRLAARRISRESLDELEKLASTIDRACKSFSPETHRLDLRFHEVIASSCGNSRLIRLFQEQQILEICFSMHAEIFQMIRRFSAVPAVSHRDIVKALRMRSPEKAEKALRNHVLGVRRKIVRRLTCKEQPGKVRKKRIREKPAEDQEDRKNL